MKLYFDTPEKIKEEYRKMILEKARNLDFANIIKENINKKPDLLGASYDQIFRLFGSLGNLKKQLNLSAFYKTDKDIIEAVKYVASLLNKTSLTRKAYLKNKRKTDPAATAQYSFMKKNNIVSYKNFIDYCLKHNEVYQEELTKTTEEIKEKNKKLEDEIKKLLTQGLYDKEIERKLGINASSIRRFRQRNGIENAYKKDLNENRGRS